MLKKHSRFSLAATRGRALRALLVFCISLLSTLGAEASLVLKSMRGRLVAPPEGSLYVQVREHEIFGIRVTEVVLGPAEIDDTLPMLVHFHGRGDQPHLPQGDHGGTPATRLLFPWAPDALGDGFTWFPLSVTERDKPEKVLGHFIRERSSQVAKVLRVMAEQRPTEGEPFVTGFSQGGMMAFALALLHPQHIDGAVPVAGWLPAFLVDEAFSESDDFPPIRAMHGSGDPIVPLAPTQALVDDLERRNVDIRLEVFPWDKHSMTDAMHTRHRTLILSLIDAMRVRRRPQA
ncbi:MAG: phospholipase/carboxylesterase [Polyangiales bacterium]